MVVKFLRIVILNLVLFALALFEGARASNIQIFSVKVSDKDTVAGTAYICFDLSWDYSFKDRLHHNWDAAWVFVKAYDDYDKTWSQVHLVNPTGSPVACGTNTYMAQPHKMMQANVPVWSEFATSIDDATDEEKTTGVFIYRKDIGSGSNLIEDIRLLWNYREDGFLDDVNLQVTVFAIEMVYIPGHTYILGDGTSPNALYAAGQNLIIRTDVQDKRMKFMGVVDGETGFNFNGNSVPDTFPKGIKPFYIMKHEISQHAYADFLNTLTIEQQEVRAQCSPYAAKGTFAMTPPAYASNPGQYRNYIRLRSQALPETDDEPATPAKFGHSLTGGNGDMDWDMETNGGNVACNFLSFDDGLAYLDWACLRPFTELEFEKACRGVRFLRKEMAWGAQYGRAINQVGMKEPYFTNPFKPNERPYDTTCCYLETGKAPWVIRCGGFAFDSSTRDQSGATYYGVMNMSDNVWERCVNVSTDAGRSFIPKEGDGALDDNGDAFVPMGIFDDTPCWPLIEGFGFRGNKVSDRTYAESVRIVNGEPDRTPYTGFRGARYAPPATKFEL